MHKNLIFIYNYLTISKLLFPALPAPNCLRGSFLYLLVHFKNTYKVFETLQDRIKNFRSNFFSISRELAFHFSPEFLPNFSTFACLPA
jgi:hypothetical protein